MPNLKQAIKRVSINSKKTEINKNKMSEVRTAVKKAHVAVSTASVGAMDLVRSAQKQIDKLAGKGKMKKNTAARRVSRLQKALNAQAK